MTRQACLYLLGLAALLLAPAAVAAPNPHGSLGASCSETADCDDPELECVTVDSKRMAGAGPAGGICTRECTTDADCDAWDTAAGCYRHSDTSAAFCFESCSQNNYETPELPADRCHGRDDIACAGDEFGFTTSMCWPMCTSDAQCDGQSCNKQFVGLCQEEPPPGGDVFATACDHTQNPTECEGFCSWYPNMLGQCSEPCIIGAPGACGAVEGEPAQAACLGWFTAGGNGIGDLGYCLELCSCNADCKTAGWACRTSGLAGPYGARGTCFPEEYVPDSIVECIEVPEDLGACVYGEVRACKGEDDCLGTARCNDDRTAYLDCECLSEPGQGGDAGAGSVGVAGATGSGGEPGSSDGGEPAAGAPPAPNPHGATPEAGCDCRQAGSTAGGAASALALLLAAGLASRRRNRAAAS